MAGKKLNTFGLKNMCVFICFLYLTACGSSGDSGGSSETKDVTQEASNTSNNPLGSQQTPDIAQQQPIQGVQIPQPIKVKSPELQQQQQPVEEQTPVQQPQPATEEVQVNEPQNEDDKRSKWGANKLKDSQRPDHRWLDKFKDITPIPVTSTIENAINRCKPNAYCVIEVDQLSLRKPVYVQRSKTKIIGKQGNRVISVNPNLFDALFKLIGNVEEVVIENLHIDGQAVDYVDQTIQGILVYGKNMHKIALLGNHIHHLYSDDYAHAISIYGTGVTEAEAVSNIIIKANNIHNMRTGYSESIVVNGNVKNWEITNNTIAHVNNIAIDAIGGEGTLPVTKINGRLFAHQLDVARYGFIEGNTITDMNTETNPAYGKEHFWSGAIYIDGARNIVIADNTVTEAEWAYDIGAENCITTQHIWMENNTASKSYFGDFIAGGYEKRGYQDHAEIDCDPRKQTDDGEGHGNVHNITVKNNHFNTSQPKVRTIELDYRIRQSIIAHESITAQHPDGVINGDQNSIRVVE